MNNLLFVDNFPQAWSANQKGNKVQLKGLAGRHELRSIVLEQLVTVKQGAAGPATTYKVLPNDNTGAGGTSDMNTLATGLFSRLYLKRDRQAFAYNIDAVEAQILYGGQHLASMLGDQIRDGDAIPVNGGNPMNVRVKVIFSFLHEAFETPNLLAPGSEQASLDGGWEISYDAGSALPTSFAGGTVVTAVSGNPAIYVEPYPCPWPIVGPTWFAKEDTFTNNQDEFFGPAIEMLFYDKRLPQIVTTGMEVNVAYVYMKNDGVEILSQTTPSQVAQAYVRGTNSMDGVRPFDISRSCTPLRFPRYDIISEERELPVTTDRRLYRQQLVAGGNPASTVVRHFVYPLELNDDSVRRVSAGLGYQNDWRMFPVRFPGRDSKYERFKAREIRPVG